MPEPKSKNSASKPPKYIRAIGRRKTSVARVRLYEGKGDNTINGLSVSQYFPGAVYESEFLTPFQTANLIGKCHVTVKVTGGGKHSQIQAISHGISRALVKYNPELKDKLKSKDLLTRDPRMKERRKAGYAQSARSRKQSPKR